MQLKRILAPALLGAAAVAAAVTVFVSFDSESIRTDAGKYVDAAVTVTTRASETAPSSASSAAAGTVSETAVTSASASAKKTAVSTKKTTAKTTAAAASKKTTKKTAAEDPSSVEKSVEKSAATVMAALEIQKVETTVTKKTTAKKTDAKKTTATKKTTKASAAAKATTTTTAPAPEEILPEGMVKTKTDSGRVIINYSRQKAMWISLFELESLMKGVSETQFRYNFDRVCRNCSGLGVNTLYVHARPLGDAFYESKLFPWSEYASGSVGRSPGYDPFKIITEVAHSYSLSVHAWINPFRCGTASEMKATPDGYLIKQWYNDPYKYPEFIAYSEFYGKYWLNPGIASVRSLISKGVKELVSGYDIDGIHIDDYFYPTEEGWFDEVTYRNYTNAGGKLSLRDWRLWNCTQTVKGIYETVKAENSALVFGIAPQGNYENNYNYMFADVALWLSQPGYCDYLAPQIYFGYNNRWKPFANTLYQWASLPRDKSVQLVIGIAAANMELQDEFYDDAGIVARQINDSFSYGAGAAIYRYDSLFSPADGYEYRAAREAEEIKKVLK